MPPKPINTIVHATKVLNLLAKNIGNIKDIAQKLDLNQATVYRTLKTLELTEYVIQDPVTRRYYLGPMIQKLLSDPITSYQNLILSINAYLEDLRDFSGETSGIQIKIGAKRMILDEVNSLHPIRYFGGKGRSWPVYSGASGKVLLAELNQKDLDNLLNKIQLTPIAPNTITDKSLLLNELQRVKEQGYAISLSETHKGGAAIAVPIKDYFEPIAIGLVGPENRMLPNQERFIIELKKTAQKISNQLNKKKTHSNTAQIPNLKAS